MGYQVVIERACDMSLHPVSTVFADYQAAFDFWLDIQRANKSVVATEASAILRIIEKEKK